MIGESIDMIENAISITAICPYCKYTKDITFCFKFGNNDKVKTDCYACDEKYYVKKDGDNFFTYDRNGNNKVKAIVRMRQ